MRGRSVARGADSAENTKWCARPLRWYGNQQDRRVGDRPLGAAKDGAVEEEREGWADLIVCGSLKSTISRRGGVGVMDRRQRQ